MGKMKKKTKITITLGVVVILVVSAFLFFVVFKDDRNKFIGTWELVEATNPGFSTENFRHTQTFYENNSLKEELINISTGEKALIYWEIYKVEFEKLYFGPEEDRFGTPLSYTFSDDDTKLTLRLNSQEYWIYSKIN